MAYATYSDVQARIPYRNIDGSSSPTSTQVTTWITEAEAVLNGALQAAQLPTSSYTAAAQTNILKHWVAEYVSGLVRMAYAAAGGDGQNDDGKDLVERFEKRIEDIFEHPTKYAAMLSAGAGVDAARRMRGHVLDNVDGDTAAAGDFGPEFTRDEVF